MWVFQIFPSANFPISRLIPTVAAETSGALLHNFRHGLLSEQRGASWDMQCAHSHYVSAFQAHIYHRMTRFVVVDIITRLPLAEPGSRGLFKCPSWLEPQRRPVYQLKMADGENVPLGASASDPKEPLTKKPKLGAAFGNGDKGDQAEPESRVTECGKLWASAAMAANARPEERKKEAAAAGQATAASGGDNGLSALEPREETLENGEETPLDGHARDINTGSLPPSRGEPESAVPDRTLLKSLPLHGPGLWRL